MARWKPIVGVVVLLAAALGGVALYVRYQVTSTLDDAATQMSPMAELRYAGVTVMPTGNVRIRGIEIRPRMFNDPLRIEAIEVETPGLWFLLTGSSKVRSGQLPEHLRTTVQGLALNLGGPIADTIDRFMAASVQSGAVPPVSNCGDIRYFDFGAYARLGYPALVFDLTLGYRFHSDGALRVTIEARTRDIGLATVNLDFVNVSPDLQANVTGQAPLRSFDLVYKDLSFTDRVKRFCAQASGMTVEQYVDSEVDRTVAAYGAQWGLTLGPGLRQAYRDFLTKPGEMRAQATPSSPVTVLDLRRLKPDEILARLNLKLSVNGKAVTDLSMIAASSLPTRPAVSSRDTRTSMTREGPAVRDVSTPPNASAPREVSAARAAPEPAKAPPPPTSEFRAVATTDLHRHVGKTVRVHLPLGLMREGRLTEMREDVAVVVRHFQGGSITLPIPLRVIERVEVEVLL